MSDFNSPQTTQSSTAGKTYVERVQYLEDAVSMISNTLMQFQSGIQSSNDATRDTVSMYSLLNENFEALLELLSEVNPAITKETVNVRATNNHVAKIRSVVDKGIADGQLKPTDAVTSAGDLITYKTNDIAFGYTLVQAFQPELASKLVDTKATAGTVLEEQGLTILGIYEVLTPKGQNDAQEVVSQ